MDSLVSIFSDPSPCSLSTAGPRNCVLCKAAHWCDVEKMTTHLILCHCYFSFFLSFLTVGFKRWPIGRLASLMAVFLAAAAGNSSRGDMQSLWGELSKHQCLMQHLPPLCLLLCKASNSMKIGMDTFSKHSVTAKDWSKRETT